jgi:hypothetical protein
MALAGVENRHQLRPYQVEIGRAVLDSVLNGKGLTFTAEIARQGGKNELSAQLELLLLTLHMGKGGNMVKASPTFRPQGLISLMRLRDRLEDAGLGDVAQHEQGYMIRLGRARQIFLSGDESANVVGQTADILLEVDEAQDVGKQKFSKEFRPMASAGNATAVLYGTAWDDDTLLEEVKQRNLELEWRDGIKRHFEFDWQEIARYNPDYRRFVEGERERLGEDHPLFLTQYCLQPLPGAGSFLNGQQRAQLQGRHVRRSSPEKANGLTAYVAGVDVAGFAEELSPLGEALDARQDLTVVTIGEVNFADADGVIHAPQVRVVEHYRWTGAQHSELFPKLADLLGNVWGCRRVVVDATGVGEGIASFLVSALGKNVVVPFRFSAQSKSRLGFELLGAVNSGRLKMYAGDGSAEYREFWHQMVAARRSFRVNQTMNFFVEPSRGHDDFLMSLALLVEAASDDIRPRRARGRRGER